MTLVTDNRDLEEMNKYLEARIEALQRELKKYKNPCPMCCNRGHYPIGTICPQCQGKKWI